MRPFLLCCTLLLFLANCQQDNSNTLKDLRNQFAPEVQRFTVPIGRDTSITCKNGTVLHFCKNSFLTTKSRVLLEVQEVFTRAEMLALQLNTRTVNGQVLESAGMLNIQPVDDGTLKINPDCPIRVDFPAKAVTDHTLLFSGTETGGLVRWKNPRKLDNDSLIAVIAEGRRLFCAYCAYCHDKQLDKPLTGPPLGNIHLDRTMDWLVRFTKNSQRMIQAGDRFALQTWSQYKPTMMNDFEFLSDAEITAIYNWIAEESKRQGIPKTNRVITEKDSALIEKTARMNLLGIRYYTFPSDKFLWRNCDIILAEIPEAQFAVTVKNSATYDELEVVLVYENRNLVLELVPLEKSFVVRNWDFNARLPTDEPVFIQAFGVKGRQLYTGQLRTHLSAKNRFELKLSLENPERVNEFFKSISVPIIPKGNGCTTGWAEG